MGSKRERKGKRDERCSDTWERDAATTPSNDDVVRTWNRKGCVHARARGRRMGRRTRDAWCGPPREKASDGNGRVWWCPRPSTKKNTVDGNVVRVDARGSAGMGDGQEWQRPQNNPTVH